ncbi:MAG: N-acetyl-gamma-glutamyl-phosphate reductase [Chloroflexi bacterium HGW-Chloroflexi-1]|nr:MAG: N-acetyl-gamma-glutamyl-phosphate reductase [Chloroflexi bacterium HGW-Chloroflexi-1]
MIRIGIVGATGYTGLELLKLLEHHPAAEIAWLTSENSAGQLFGDVFPVPPALGRHRLVASADADLAAADLVFCCLPHAASQAQVAAARAAGARVVDLSADFRLHDAETYERWYGVPHAQRELLARAVYGLPELHRAEIARADLVANPGCYPTSVILGLAPLARAGWLSGTVIADSKSGVSGAGRKPALKTHFVEANENLSPYSIGRAHRHLVEMEQELRMADGGWQMADGRWQIANTQYPIPDTQYPISVPQWQLIFSPHLAPVSRGMLSTIYVTLPEDATEAAVRERYAALYTGEPFVYLLPAGQVATFGHTVHTNYCAIGLTFVPDAHVLIVTSSIDNLVKGASGQAVQNMNIMFGVAETMGVG